MKRTHRSVRVDPELLAGLEELARKRLVPVSFTDQVEAGLRLLMRQAAEQQTRHAAGLVGVDKQRAARAFQQTRDRGPRR